MAAARRPSKAKPSLRAQFFKFDDRLSALGVPPLTAWWRAGIGKWLDAYEKGRVLELWGCAGRGSSKSTALYKLACFFALFGVFLVPPGERHFAVVLSRLKEEAEKAIPIIAAWLTLLGVAHRVVGDVIELSETPRGIRVVAASVSATSGWRAFFVAKDERSKWPTGGVADLDAEEIDTSAAAMTATHALAPVVSFGSAWGQFGAFYDAIVSGTDDSKVVLGPTPTWIAAPHITEESTHKKERNLRRWKREFACEFQAGALGCFEIEDIDRAFRPREESASFGDPVLVIDASSGGQDRFTYCVARFEAPPAPLRPPGRVLLGRGAEVELTDSEPFIRLMDVVGLEPAEVRALGTPRICARIAALARVHGVTRVHGDQRDAFPLTSAFKQVGLRLVTHTWNGVNKPDAMEIVRDWLRAGRLALPVHETFRRELLNYEERVVNDRITTAARTGHDDFVSLLLTLAMAHVAGGLRRPRPTGPDGTPVPRTPLTLVLHHPYAGAGPAGGFWADPTNAPTWQKTPGWWKRGGGGQGGAPPAPAGGTSDF